MLEWQRGRGHARAVGNWEACSSVRSLRWSTPALRALPGRVKAACALLCVCLQVNFYAREEYEIIPNYKVLQGALVMLEITRVRDGRGRGRGRGRVEGVGVAG